MGRGHPAWLATPMTPRGIMRCKLPARNHATPRTRTYAIDSSKGKASTCDPSTPFLNNRKYIFKQPGHATNSVRSDTSNLRFHSTPSFQIPLDVQKHRHTAHISTYQYARGADVLESMCSRRLSSGISPCNGNAAGALSSPSSSSWQQTKVHARMQIPTLLLPHALQSHGKVRNGAELTGQGTYSLGA